MVVIVDRGVLDAQGLATPRVTRPGVGAHRGLPLAVAATSAAAS